MLTGAAPVMKLGPQGDAWRAVVSGREVASRNQRRTAYPSGKYDFFGSAQHSFGRWVKRGLRGSFVVLIVLILPACATISEEDNVIFRNMHDLAWSTWTVSAVGSTPENINHCFKAPDGESIDYMNFSECTIAILEHYLPAGMTQRLSRTGQFADPKNYRVGGGGVGWMAREMRWRSSRVSSNLPMPFAQDLFLCPPLLNVCARFVRVYGTCVDTCSAFPSPQVPVGRG